MKFYVSRDLEPKVTILFTILPASSKWIKVNLIKNNKIIFKLVYLRDFICKIIKIRKKTIEKTFHIIAFYTWLLLLRGYQYISWSFLNWILEYVWILEDWVHLKACTSGMIYGISFRKISDTSFWCKTYISLSLRK